MKKQEFLKNEERLRNLWDNFKCSNIQIIGVPEGEKGDQEIEYLFEKIMKENFSSLVKELDMQVQQAQRVPQKSDPRRNTPRYFIIKMPKVKDKDRILKTERDEQIVTYKRVPIKLSADFSKETLQARRDWQEVFKDEKQGPTSKITLNSKAII